MIDLTNPTTVTAENLDAIREMLPCDMADELAIGCEVWKCGGYNEPKRTLLRCPNGRGAWCWGGNSEWGDWSADGILTTDDGTRFGTDGNPVEV